MLMRYTIHCCCTHKNHTRGQSCNFFILKHHCSVRVLEALALDALRPPRDSDAGPTPLPPRAVGMLRVPETCVLCPMIAAVLGAGRGSWG